MPEDELALPPENSLSSPLRLDTERQQKAGEYSRLQRRFAYIQTIIIALAALGLIFGGLSASFTGHLGLPLVWSAVVYFGLIALVYEIFSLPFGYYTGYVLGKRYGVLSQTRQAFFTDAAKSFLITLVLGGLLVAAVYAVMDTWPDIWWLLVWLGFLAVSMGMTFIAPVWLIPLFYSMKPMAEGKLRDSLLELCRRIGVYVRGIYVIELSARGTAANAALMGLGRTRRIVLSDNMIDRYSIPEIEVIMSHEIAHQQHNDMLRLFSLQAAILFGVLAAGGVIFSYLSDAVGYQGLADPAGLPLLGGILLVLLLLISPVISLFTRKIEKQADEFALNISNNPAAFRTAMTRLTNQNLSEAEPSNWLERLTQDHPSYMQRIRLADEFEKRHSLDRG
ncbi:M48 family metallopeptidase [Dehalococcoides mccartyi]|uniref:M48 family metallopeptidase n=1 Tax=Dehalococcoides mccartyi TaxID=61435 RepID=UPI0003C83786|nr:M48 family metallopeptidase [Dehalococcoides mccartyi]AHB14032.1 peptidase, M48 family [Dehalococcoides mccartyi GY50]